MPRPDSAFLRAQLARIWGGTLTLIAMLALVFALYGTVDYRAQYALAESEAEEIADMAALNAEGSLLAAEQLLAGLTALLQHAPEAATPHSPSIRDTLHTWLESMPYLMDLLIAEPPGRILHWTGPGVPPDISDRQYVRHHLETTDSHLYIGEPQTSKVHRGKWFFGISKALRGPRDEVRQVVVATINLEIFGETLGARFSTAGSTVAIASGDGIIYARLPDNVRHVGKRLPMPPEAAKFPPGTHTGRFAARSPLDDRLRVIAFHQLRGTHLYAVGSTDVREIMAPWRQRLVLAVGLWLLLSTAALWFANRLSAAARKHETLAATDGLTGVLNRRSLLGLVESQERRGGDSGKLAVLMVDVDHFKSINDSYGHACGDEVLCRVADALRTCCRQSDLIGRYGGEEFLVLLDTASPEDALALAEKMRLSVATIATPRGPVTVSIGVAVTSTLRGTLDEAIRRADAAMYAAKTAGRNCVRLAEVITAQAPTD